MPENRKAMPASCATARARWIQRLTSDMELRLSPKARDNPRIGIIGALGFDDVGDEAMLVSLVDELRAWNPRIHFSVFSARPEATTGYLGMATVPTLHRWVFNKRNPLSLLLHALVRVEAGMWKAIPPTWVDPVSREGWVQRIAFSLARRYVLRQVRPGSLMTGGGQRSVLSQHLLRLASLDALIVLGGGYLNSWHVKGRASLWTITIEAAARLGVLVYATGLNLGPFNSYDLRAVARALRHCYLIGLRDWHESVDALKAMGLYSDTTCHYSCDDAIALAADHLGDGRLIQLVAHNQPYVVVQLHRWLLSARDVDRLLERVAVVLEQVVIRRGLRVLMVPMSFGSGELRERSILEALATKLSQRDKIAFLPPGLHPKQVKYAFTGARAALVTRHHGLVFSVGAGVPVVGLVFDRYYRMKMQGIADWSEGLARLLPFDSDVNQIEAALRNALGDAA